MTQDEMLAEARRLNPAPIRDLCPEAMLAYALLQEAHDACFNAPDRDVLGMSRGPFSGVNRVLGLICDMSDSIRQLQKKLKEQTGHS